MEIVVLSGQIEFGVGQMGTEKEQAFEKIHKDSRVKLMKYIHIDCVFFLFLKYGTYLTTFICTIPLFAEKSFKINNQKFPFQVSSSLKVQRQWSRLWTDPESKPEGWVPAMIPRAEARPTDHRPDGAWFVSSYHWNSKGMFDELVDVVSRLWNSKTFLRPLRHENHKKLFYSFFCLLFQMGKRCGGFSKERKK